jgi:hypothetical protein
MFADTMIEGPFRYWLHRHIVTPVSETMCTLTDDVTYALPFGALGQLVGGWFARRELDRLFDYRHAVTRTVCEAHGGDGDDGGSHR